MPTSNFPSSPSSASNAMPTGGTGRPRSVGTLGSGGDLSRQTAASPGASPGSSPAAAVWRPEAGTWRSAQIAQDNRSPKTSQGEWNRVDRGSGPVRVPPPTNASLSSAAAAAAAGANITMATSIPTVSPGASRPRTPARASPGLRPGSPTSHSGLWRDVPAAMLPPQPQLPAVPAALPPDDEDLALQEAIRASLEDAEQQKRIEWEDGLVAAEAAAQAEAMEAIAIADEAEAAAAAADALRAADEAEEAEEQEKLLQRRREAAKRKGPLPPPPGIAETFAPKQWLSDASLTFAYGCLTEPPLAALQPEGCNSDLRLSAALLSEVVLLMDPATAFWLTAQDNDSHLAEAKDALKLRDRELVICPINDSTDCSLADAGTHWTLLVCWDRRFPENKGSDLGCFGRFSYYDSLGSNSFYGARDANLQQAETLASRLAGRSVQVSVGSCARQTNGFDCGVYVLLFSEIVALTFSEARARGCAFTAPTSSPASSFSRGKSRGSNRANPEPVWEKRLSAVTPKEVDDRRAMFYQVLTQASTIAAAGA